MLENLIRSLVIFLFIILEMDCIKSKDAITFDELIEGLLQLFKVSIFLEIVLLKFLSNKTKFIILVIL